MLQPNFEEIKSCDGRRVIVTGAAPDESEYDFFTRVFCPKFELNEVLLYWIYDIFINLSFNK
jgi:predicted PhzF superfamily epimerase YddE/YHI9